MVLRSKRLKRLLILVCAFFFVANLLTLLLPYDSPILLSIRFNTFHFLNNLRGRIPHKDDWLYAPPRYPVNFHDDVGLLIKTGFGTRQRVPAQLEALGLAARQRRKGLVIVGDWGNGKVAISGTDIQDAVGGVMNLESMASLKNSTRFKMYAELQDAIGNGDSVRAHELGVEHGWELDALKFIWGLEHIYDVFPEKKWYIILDDDTYIVKPSVIQLLGHLDHTKPLYIGNPVGDYRGRFAHGGSAIVISSAAAKTLFSQPDIVLNAHHQALDGETWGDRLVATTLQKVGVYLDEQHGHLFNGEGPRITRIKADRYCAPLLSFHGVRDPAEMRQIGVAFRDMDDPIRWGRVWDMYGAPSLKDFKRQPIKADRDFVGQLDEEAENLEGLKSAEECAEGCRGLGDACLAWVWKTKSSTCRASPWMIVGGRAEGTMSGINVAAVERLRQGCPDV